MWDCIECYLADEAIVEDRIDKVLTLFRSYEDNRAIGFQIKGVKKLVELLEADGVGVQIGTEEDGEKGILLKEIAIAALNKSAEEEEEVSGDLRSKSDFLDVCREAGLDETIPV